MTAELDPERAARAREALAGTPAEVLEGDWQELLPARGPFDVVFADGGVDYDRVADLLAPGGILIKDDLTPGRPVEGDSTREALLLDPRLESVEVLVTAEMACIVFYFNWDNGYFWTNRGVEFALLWMLLAIAIFFRGGGRYSLDRLIGKEL